MQTITPFLWFDHQAEEVAAFYTSVFTNSEILETQRYAEGSSGAAGSVMSVTFSLDGQELVAFNGGPGFSFSAATSFFVNCETQAEVDRLWDALSAGGEPQMCGWLTDKYGVTWQIVPTALGRLLGDPDPAKSQRVMEAMLKMIKLDVEGLQRAYDGV